MNDPDRVAPISLFPSFGNGVLRPEPGLDQTRLAEPPSASLDVETGSLDTLFRRPRAGGEFGYKAHIDNAGLPAREIENRAAPVSMIELKT